MEISLALRLWLWSTLLGSPLLFHSFGTNLSHLVLLGFLLHFLVALHTGLTREATSGFNSTNEVTNLLGLGGER